MNMDGVDEKAAQESRWTNGVSAGPTGDGSGPRKRCTVALNVYVRLCGQELLDACHYRTLCDHSPVGKKQALALYPNIAAAEAINADEAKTRLLKIAVLGEIDVPEIAQQLSLDAAVVETWEKLFFNVRGLRSAFGWIDPHVIRPELAAGRADLAARLRMVCAVGPLGAQVILRADTRLPIDESQRLFERQLKLHLKFDAAMELTLDTPKNQIFFLRRHMALMQEEKRLELAREKLEKKCVEAINRHKLSMIQAEIALERERSRAAARARREEGLALAELGEEECRKQLAAHDASRNSPHRRPRPRASPPPPCRSCGGVTARRRRRALLPRPRARRRR